MLEFASPKDIIQHTLSKLTHTKVLLRRKQIYKLRSITSWKTSSSRRSSSRYIASDAIWTKPVIQTFNSLSNRVTLGTSNTDNSLTLLTVGQKAAIATSPIKAENFPLQKFVTTGTNGIQRGNMSRH